MVAGREDGAALHRRAGLPVHPILALDDDFGFPGRRLDVAAFERASAEEIVAPVLVHERAAGPQRRDRIDHGVEHVVINRHRRGEVFRLGAARRDAGGDRLADIPHLVGRERRPGRRLDAGGMRHDADRLHPRQVRGGKHAAFRLGRHKNRSDAGVRVRAAQKYDMPRAGQADIGDELAAPAQVPVVLLAQDRGSDPVSGLRRAHRRFSRPFRRELTVPMPMLARSLSTIESSDGWSSWHLSAHHASSGSLRRRFLLRADSGRSAVASGRLFMPLSCHYRFPVQIRAGEGRPCFSVPDSGGYRSQRMDSLNGFDNPSVLVEKRAGSYFRRTPS